MKFYLKKHKNGLVAICDANLIGKSLEGKEISIKVSEGFYGGNLVDEKRAILALRSARISNLIGKEIVSLAIREGFVNEENVFIIDKVPHTQILKL